MRFPTALSFLVLVPLAGCAGSAEDTASAEAAATPAPPVKVTVKSTDSKAADAFLNDLIGPLVDLASAPDDRPGPGDDPDVTKIKRNDGTIACTITSKLTSCTFELTPKEMMDGAPLLQGDRNSLAGAIHGKVEFNQREPVMVASLAKASGKKDPKMIILGDPKGGIFIECVDAPPDGTFSPAICVFHLEKKKK